LALALALGPFGSLWIGQGVDEQLIRALLIGCSDRSFAGAAETGDAAVAAVAARLAAGVVGARFVAGAALAASTALFARFTRFARVTRLAGFA